VRTVSGCHCHCRLDLMCTIVSTTCQATFRRKKRTLFTCSMQEYNKGYCSIMTWPCIRRSPMRRCARRVVNRTVSFFFGDVTHIVSPWRSSLLDIPSCRWISLLWCSCICSSSAPLSMSTSLLRSCRCRVQIGDDMHVIWSHALRRRKEHDGEETETYLVKTF
jgi:hypothetical protein